MPTLHAPRSVVLNAEESPESVLPQSLRKAHEVIEANARSFRAAHEAGVKVAMGTDCGVGTHGTNAWELELMVQHGMTPMEAIVATTKTAAECVHMDADVGTLEPGKLADLIVVDGDPLADVALLQQRDRISLVMQGGEPVVARVRPRRRGDPVAQPDRARRPHMTTIVTGATLIDGTGAEPVPTRAWSSRMAASRPWDASTRCQTARASSTWAARRSCRA